jgi:HlyD family secretion protein
MRPSSRAVDGSWSPRGGAGPGVRRHPSADAGHGLDRLVVSVPLRGDEASASPPTPAPACWPRRWCGSRPAPTPRQDRLAVFALDPPAPAVLSGESGGEAPLRPGVAATVEIELPAREGVLLVPNAALGFTPHGVGARARSMFWRQGRSASGRRVDRRQRRRRTEILANGLEPGVQVITGRRHSPVVQGAGGRETGTGPARTA